MHDPEIREGWFDSDCHFVEGEVVAWEDAVAAIHRCYDLSAKQHSYLEDALAETYRCFFSATSDLEISIHTPSRATVTYRSEAVKESQWFGFMSRPFERAITIADRSVVLEVTRRFFELPDVEMAKYVAELRT